jgi:hypothetical protein
MKVFAAGESVAARALHVHSDAQLAGFGPAGKVGGNHAGVSMIVMRHLHLT